MLSFSASSLYPKTSRRRSASVLVRPIARSVPMMIASVIPSLISALVDCCLSMSLLKTGSDEESREALLWPPATSLADLSLVEPEAASNCEWSLPWDWRSLRMSWAFLEAPAVLCLIKGVLALSGGPTLLSRGCSEEAAEPMLRKRGEGEREFGYDLRGPLAVFYCRGGGSRGRGVRV